MVELALDRKVGVDDALAPPGATNQIGQAVVALRPHDEVDGLLAPDHLAALGLGDAARDRQRHAAVRTGLLQLAELTEFGIDLFGRPLADMAGVEDDEIRLLHRRRLDIALRRQDVGHAGRIIGIHLTAVGSDEKLERVLAGAAGLPTVRRGRQVISRGLIRHGSVQRPGDPAVRPYLTAFRRQDEQKARRSRVRAGEGPMRPRAKPDRAASRSRWRPRRRSYGSILAGDRPRGSRIGRRGARPACCSHPRRGTGF